MSDHKITKTTEQRDITKHICAQDNCIFFGRDAQQGVCYTSDGEVAMFAALDKHERELEKELREMRQREGDDYVRALEVHYVTAMMNWRITTDDCVRLRRDLALAKEAAREAARDPYSGRTPWPTGDL